MTKFLASFVLSILTSMWNGFVLWKLWEWFAVPLGAMDVSYWHAYALGLFVSWAGTIITVVSPLDTAAVAQMDEKEQGARVISLAIIKSVMMAQILFVAWMVHLFAGI